MSVLGACREKYSEVSRVLLDVGAAGLGHSLKERTAYATVSDSPAPMKSSAGRHCLTYRPSPSHGKTSLSDPLPVTIFQRP